jgi:hypothetical protein
MDRFKTYKPLGVALLVLGALLFALGFSAGGSELRIAGPTVAFFGIAILAQAKKRVQG